MQNVSSAQSIDAGSPATTLAGTANPLATASYRKIGWRIIPFVVLCYVAAYIDRANIGFARLQFMRDLHISEAAYGLGGGMFYLGYSLFQVPSNLMLARVGARLTLLTIMVLWGLFSAAMAFITGPTHFYTLRFLIGAAEAGFFPGMILYLSRWAPPSRRARFTALFLAAIPISGIIAGPLSGTIMTRANGVAGLQGWQWLLLSEGVPTCILALLAYFYLDENPAEARWLTIEQKEIVLADLAAAQPAVRSKRTGLAGALSDPRFYALAVMAVGAIAGSAAIGLWLPAVIRGTGVADTRVIGLLSTIPYAAAIVAQYAVARNSDRLRERRWHTAGAAFASGCAWLLLPLAAHDPWISVGLLTIASMGIYAAAGPFWAMPAESLSGSAAAGGVALISTCGGIGAFVSPIIVGWANQLTHALALGQVYYGLLAILCGTVLILGARGDQPAQSEK